MVKEFIKWCPASLNKYLLHYCVLVNPFELNYYLFMFSLDKCNGSFNVADDLSAKICVTSETKDVNIKVFNVITKPNEAKALLKHISCNRYCIW